MHISSLHSGQRPVSLRWLPLGLCTLVIGMMTGCGFYLRGHLTLPPDFAEVQVQSSTPYSTLVKILRQMIRASNISVVADNEAASAGAVVGQLNILSERWGDLPIAIDAHGRVQEYSVRYATLFTLIDAKNTVIVPQQMVELSRDYLSPPQDATGTATEREILANELRREMAASILRRVDSVVRHRLQTTRPTMTRQVPALSQQALPSGSNDQLGSRVLTPSTPRSSAQPAALQAQPLQH